MLSSATPGNNFIPCPFRVEVLHSGEMEGCFGEEKTRNKMKEAICWLGNASGGWCCCYERCTTEVHHLPGAVHLSRRLK